MKNDNLAAYTCPKCKKIIAYSLPGCSIRCPKCKRWSKHANGKRNT